MTAREVFRIGQRVRLAEAFLQQNQYRYRRARTGVVVGYGNDKSSVRVQRDALKTADTWFMGYIEPDDATAGDREGTTR